MVCLFSPLSSNGKSVSWAQTERSSSRGNHLWQRLSFHIKRKENNQTAIIKPFSKTPDGRYCGGGDLPPHVPLPSLPSIAGRPDVADKTLYELSEAEERYPVAVYRPQTPSPISTVSQRLGGAGRGEELGVGWAGPAVKGAESTSHEGASLVQLNYLPEVVNLYYIQGATC